MASDIWKMTTHIAREETRCRHIGYSFRLTARVLLYAPSHRQDNTYHGLCYTSRGALAGTRNSSMGPPHEGSIRRPNASRANAFTTMTNNAWWSDVYLKCTSHDGFVGRRGAVAVHQGAVFVHEGRAQVISVQDIQPQRGEPAPRVGVAVVLANKEQMTEWMETRKEGNGLFNDALNTFYLRVYGVRHMVKDHSDSDKGNPLPPHRLLFVVSSKGYFICTIPQTG